MQVKQSSIKTIIGKLPVDKFEHVLSKADFNFPSEYIKQIIEDAPKSEKREIMYRDLYIKLKVLVLCKS